MVTVISLLDEGVPQHWAQTLAQNHVSRVVVGVTRPLPLDPSYEQVRTSGSYLDRLNYLLVGYTPTTEWTLILDPRVVGQGDWIDRAVKELASWTNAGLVGFTTVSKGMILQAGGGYTAEGVPQYFLSGQPAGQAVTQPVGWVDLHAWMIRDRCLREVPYIRPFPQAEVALGREAVRLGWQAVNLAQLVQYQGQFGSVTQVEPGPAVSWRGPIYDVSGYSAEARQLVEWFPQVYDLQLAVLQWGVGQVRLTAQERSWLEERTKPTIEARVQIQHTFSRYFEPFTGYAIGRSMFETSRLPAEWVAGLKHVDEVWVPSGFCKDLFELYHNKVRVVPSPIDVEVYHPVEESYGSLRERPTCRFLFVSEWLKRKGWREMLDAWDKAFTKDDPVELYIKTYSAFGWTADKIARDIGLRHNVYLIHLVLSEIELNRLYNSCHCLIHPAHSEGFGRTVAEMLAAGGEVISSNATGLAEIQRYGMDARWVDIPEEALDEMYHCKDGQHRWTDFSQDALVEELRASYRRWQAGEQRSDREWIVRNFSGPVVNQRMLELLTPVVPWERH